MRLDRYLLLYNDNGVVRRRRLHRCPCRTAGALAADRPCMPPPPLSHGPTCGCARSAWSSRRPCWCSAVRSSSRRWSPALFERFYVKPSELQLEAPYMQRNIALTREAYNLDKITVKPFPGGPGPDLSVAAGQPRDRSTTSGYGTGSRCSTPMRSCRKSAPTTNSSTSTSIATISTAPISR